MNSYTAVIPVHNGERTIFQALCSLHRQTIQPNKIVIFDNCSNDSTLAEIQKFKKISKIPVHLEKSDVLLAQRESFARSLEGVEGRFCWLAADDMLFPWAAEKMLSARCGLDCQHSVGGSTVFLNDNSELTFGKILERELNSARFLRNPADNSLFYGMHTASIVRNYIPNETFPAWDWNFSLQCVRNGIHACGPYPLLLREYTPISSHRTYISKQKSIEKYLPYIALTKSILKIVSLGEKTQILIPLLILNIKGYIFFGRHAPMFESVNLCDKIVGLKKIFSRYLDHLKSMTTARVLFYALPKSIQKFIRGGKITSARSIHDPVADKSRLVDEVNANYREKMLSINNPIASFRCIPSENFSTAQIVEIVRYFLKFAGDNSELIIDLQNIQVNQAFIEAIAIGLSRTFPNGKVIFAPVKNRGDILETIEDFYSKIWEKDFAQDLKILLSRHDFRTRKKSAKINLFLAEVPLPNRDAGSIDVIYILTILKYMGFKVNVYIPHFNSSNMLALALLRKLSNVVLLDEFRNEKALNFVYGPYAYQGFEKYSFEGDFIYIMVDAVFRRASQSKNQLSHADKNILIYETQALQNCRYALSISEADRAEVLKKFPSTKTMLFPIMRFPHSVSKKVHSTRTKLLFIGSMNHDPNKVAVEFIVKDLAPKLLSANKRIQIVLAGVGTEFYGRFQKNVLGLGQVSDLNGLYAECFATIAPMNIAAGVNGKVIESLCFRIPAIISEAVSMNLPHGLIRYCEIAKNTDEYVLIAEKLFNESLEYKQYQFQLNQVNGTSNMETIKELLREV